MRVVFMGTPSFSVPSLRHLAAEHEVALVLTRPDAVRSRGKKLEPSPVKVAAIELGLPVVFVDERLSSREAKRILREEGMTEKQMRGKVDMVAASLFLQSWLDARQT